MACAETCLIGIAPPAAEIVICDLTDNQLISPFRFSGPDDRSIYVDANTRIQIIETMMDLPTADKEQNAAFVVSLFISGCICTSFFRVPFSCHVVSRGSHDVMRRMGPHICAFLARCEHGGESWCLDSDGC